MIEKIAQSNVLEDRFIDFAARIMKLANRLQRGFCARHVAKQILRSGTSVPANYAEARSVESRADFIHNMKIVGKELNETSVWLRLIVKSSLLSSELLVEIVAENTELIRIVGASIRTARLRSSLLVGWGLGINGLVDWSDKIIRIGDSCLNPLIH